MKHLDISPPKDNKLCLSALGPWKDGLYINVGGKGTVLNKEQREELTHWLINILINRD